MSLFSGEYALGNRGNLLRRIQALTHGHRSKLNDMMKFGRKSQWTRG
ncbi:hypothetical protein BAQU_0355 [Bifidobacterium aquikefiri]|uniref:Uncharacterized protein n=1 Tax=Bifidobacterium aquikefiri TaxID=1653207 RepID=A0A261G8F4_9BIFI|nr:hypothetical protein BAQU_0355 [Bifidobacterium aquikefiri]